MPYIFAFAVTMIFAALVLPRTSGRSTYCPLDSTHAAERSIYSFLFLWLALAFFSGTFIWGNVSHNCIFRFVADGQGTSFVSWPRLNPPLEILSYNGPGTRSLQRGRGMTVSKMIPFFDKKRGNMNVALGHGRKVEEVELGKRKGALID